MWWGADPDLGGWLLPWFWYIEVGLGLEVGGVCLREGGCVVAQRCAAVGCGLEGLLNWAEIFFFFFSGIGKAMEDEQG